MKKAVLLAFCIFVMATGSIVGIASAGLSAYSLTECGCISPATIDGKWTTADEWTDSYRCPLSFNGVFGYDIDFSTYGIEWVIEPFFDSTNNTGDILQICVDNTNAGGNTPIAGDFKIEITGHTTCKLYNGATGNKWTEVSSSEILWKDSLTTSPWGNATHWVIEVKDPDKTTGNLVTDAPPNGMMISYYDAATNKWSSWAPNANDTQPGTWGLIAGFSMDPVPEGFTVALVTALSTFAVAGAILVRKRITLPKL
jgi:hypothetical protein